jgi:phosphoglycolate phosphatase
MVGTKGEHRTKQWRRRPKGRASLQSLARQIVMHPPVLVFDLDGTLSDPLEGIANSINHSLAEHGFSHVSAGAISAYIGPPMDFIFGELTKSNDASLIDACIATYRGRYAKIGYAENHKYEGIDPLLVQLRENGHTMGICTSKRRDFAQKIVSLFEWDEYFTFISGGDVGIEKSHQLAQLLANGQINNSAIMIGDRAVDIAAAKANGLRSAGVLWGHGSHLEIEEASPDWIIDTPGELLKLAGQQVDSRDAASRRP